MGRTAMGLLLCWALLLPGVAAAQPVATDRLRPGDAIRLSVWMDSTMTGQFVIDSRGIVVLPRLGPREVAGQPAEQVRAAVAAELAAALPNPSIEVTMLRRVMVRGEVRQPGTFLLASHEATVGDALSSAQGLTPDARRDRVLLVRGDEATLVRLGEGSRLAALPLQSGDELVVPVRSWLQRNPALVPALISGAFSVLITAVLVSAQ
jgi:protein involved in polysaccharide export with SLBB domain